MSESSSFEVFVHPLVVMSMADHSTRQLVQKGHTNVCGVLLGQTSGQVVSVLESFEMSFEEKDGELKMEVPTIEEDLKLYREAFPDCEVLGWYATRNSLIQTFVDAHPQMSKFTEKAFFILLNPEVTSDAKDLPMDVYELSSQNGAEGFTKVHFKVESDEAERVTLEFCAKVVQEKIEGDVSEVATPFTNTTTAIDSLNERIKVICLYLEDVKSGRVQGDQALLRTIRGLCNRLPAVDSESFRGDYMRELNDAMLMMYLATITKSTATSRSVVNNFNTAHASQMGMLRDEPAMGGLFGMGMGGFF